MSKSMKFRSWIVVALTVLILGIFVARLMNIQIKDADKYRSMLEGVDIATQAVRATRGEIVDRNGNPLAVNRMGYDVIIDKAFLPSDRQNEIIIQLINLFESLGEDWTDSLPLSKYGPYTYLPNQESQVNKLKNHLELGSYATAGDALWWLAERYKLQDYNTVDQRKIASVRYEMEQRGFAINVPYTFATDIDIGTVVQVKERSHVLLGVDVTESAIRYYPDGTVAPHIIGTIGPIYAGEYAELKEQGYFMDDTLGKGGVELAFESVLRGTNGTREITIDSRGNVIKAMETQPPVPGNTLMLTIDSDMQKMLSESLPRQIKFLQDTSPPGEGKEANAGSAVVIDVKTGELLAAVTYPSYDLNTYRQSYSDLNANEELPLVNRALHGVYRPGSTFKPVVATAGLAHGIVDEAATVTCGGVYTFYPGSYQPTCLSVHGPINVLRALQVSCNIFFYDVGRRVGIDNICTTATQYGLGQPTGIEIAELVGTLSSPAAKEADPNADGPWVPGDVLQSAIGQLYNEFTPLQIANYTATIANRGKRMKVTIVKEVRDYSQSTVILPLDPQVADRVEAPPEAFELVVQGMINASRIGTAASWFGNYPVDVASKTGTPQTWNLPDSTFIAFAPANNPQIAVAVVIEKGWHGYTGAPVAKDVFNYYFGYDVPVATTTIPSSTAPQDSQSSGETSEQSVDGDTTAQVTSFPPAAE